jgi:predicted amidohydrolase
MHIAWIQRAAALGADAVFFPELSLSGYNRALADGLAMDAQDAQLQPFQQVCDAHGIIAAIGAPLRTAAGVHIGMPIFRPGQPVQTYAKQYLYRDEEPYFMPGAEQAFITLGSEVIAPAICYESSLPVHAAYAVQHGATLYLASVAKSQAGIDKTSSYYPQVAKKYTIPVLLVNSIGPGDDFMGVGQSAAWRADGTAAGSMGVEEEGILLYDIATKTVSKHYR